MNYHSKKIDEVINEFNSNIDEGLNNKKVEAQTKKYGLNILPKKEHDSILKIFFSGLLDPLVMLLIATIILSFIIGEYIDGIIVFFIVIVDLIVGTIEENQANKNADSLQKLIKFDVKVIRNGLEKVIDSSEIVPGDIVLLESGDKLACDMRIISCSNLQVDESVLTGESVGVYKNNDIYKDDTPLADRRNMLYAGCSIITGRAKAIAVSTGVNTQVGCIADTVSKIKEEKSPLTIRMDKLSKQISLMIIIVAIIIAIVLIIKGYSLVEIFMSVIALSVSAMPEGLPLALTMALTITSKQMSKRKVIVKKLNYVESLGSCTVIATDKTGTLTVNEQTAKVIVLPNNREYEVSGTGYNNKGKIEKLDVENDDLVDKICLHGKLNNEATISGKKYYGDSIDIAFLVLANKNNTFSDDYEVIKRIPYESENKYSAVFYMHNNEMYCTVKGSYEVVSSFCDKMYIKNKTIKIDNELLEMQNELLAKRGYRVICVASGKVSKFKMKDFYVKEDIPKLTFEGMVGFIDPIRSEVKEAVCKCYDAGVKVLMITGDHPLTAYSIAQELKIADNYDEVTTGVELNKYYNLGEKKFDEFIKDKSVFARVTPMDKLNIVSALKRSGEFVAVTGDGVNDAPAIRNANLGVSMGSGTDVAKETASMIIIDDNFKSIVSGIELGRCAYSNIRKVSYFLLSCGLAEVLFYLLSIIFNLPMPLVAIQLLWLNLVTDGLQDIALSCEKSEKGIMKEKPINPKDSIFNKDFILEIIFSGLTIGLLVFGVWILLIKKVQMDETLARGYIMALMVFIQNIHVFNCRSEKKSAFTVSLKNNPVILIAIFGSIFLQILVMEIPTLSEFLKTSAIPYNHMFLLLGMSFTVLIVMEIYKLIKYRKDY